MAQNQQHKFKVQLRHRLADLACVVPEFALLYWSLQISACVVCFVWLLGCFQAVGQCGRQYYFLDPSAASRDDIAESACF